MELGAELAHDDVAGKNVLAAESLDAPALPRTVAAVAGTAACFFMCHGVSPSNRSQAVMDLIFKVVKS